MTYKSQSLKGGNSMKRISLLIISLLFLTACSFNNSSLTASYDSGNDSITLNKDGSVNAVIYDVFDKDYYSESELVDMINEEIGEYNAEHQGQTITLGQHSVKDGKVSVEMIFSSVKSYNDYMPERIYSGNMSGVQISGYDLNQTLISTDGSGNSIGKAELINMSSENVVIVNDSITVNTPGKILYYSQGMKLNAENSASASENGTYFIVYNK